MEVMELEKLLFFLYIYHIVTLNPPFVTRLGAQD